MAGLNIKTGVDKLVDLVSEKKRVSVDDAAKKLGVGKDVVQEWAEFLEEEGLVTLEYNLSKVIITERKITKEDVIKGGKDITSEKDAFARKIDVAITTLNKETSGFEGIRKEFANIQSHIKGEIEIVKKQLSELEKYESLKKNLDKDIQKQRQDYEQIVKDAQEKLHLESQKYEELKGVIGKERKNLEQYSQKMDELRKLRNDYDRTINSLKDSLKNIDAVMNDYKKKFDVSNKMIDNYRSALDKLDSELSERKSSNITKRIEEIKSNQDRLFKNQISMESELQQKMNSMQSYSGVGDRVHKSFEGFFSKNIDTEKLISDIESDKTDLTKELESLRLKVTTFTILVSNANVRSQLKEIEDKLKTFERKKAAIKFKIETLLSLIKGK